MGNELTRDIEKRLKERKLNSADVRRHGWDKNNKSPHLSILSGGVTVKKTTKSNHKEVALGSVPYSQGVHVFQVTWTPGSNQHVAIGIASEDIEVHSESGDHLLGNDDQSVAWELTSHDIVFNGCVIKQMPPATHGAAGELPSTLIMVLDMNEGTLGFKAGECFDTAMRGLKHVSDAFHVAACLDKYNDEVTVKYLGDPDAATSSAVSMDEPLRFHDTCGKNVVLSSNNTVATRWQPKNTFSHATVFTNRPLKHDEMFSVSLKQHDDTKWSGSLIVGVSTVSASEVNFIDWMPSCEQGKSCLYNGSKIKDGGNETETKTNIDKLTEGSTIGLRRAAGTDRLEFYVNGEREAVIRSCIGAHEDIYGCVDVYGQAVAVSLLSKYMGSKDEVPNLKGQIIVAGKTPARRVFLNAIEETLKLMANRSLDNVPMVCKAIEDNMIYPYEHGTDKKLHVTVAEQLAWMDCGAIFKSYLQFLKLCDMDSEQLSVQCYDVILHAAWLYSSESLLLCREFGESELLEAILKELNDTKDVWAKSPGKRNRAQKLIGICHNCSKATENKAIFQKHHFPAVSAYYVNSQDSKIGISAMLASSYVIKPNESAYLEMPTKLCRSLLEFLKEASHKKPYTSSGFSATELTTGITNLCVCEANIPRFIEAGARSQLTRMLTIHDGSMQECALNALWTLTTKESHEQIRKTDKLMALLREAEVSVFGEVKQAARRLIIKLEKLATPLRKLMSEAKVSEGCKFAELCKEFKASLKLSEDYFDKQYDMCYCDDCHGNRGDRGYYTRGNPPKEYGLPIGWFRFALKPAPKAKALKAFEQWHRAYHGTKREFIASILEVGELVPAGRKVLGGKDVKELPNHFSDDRKPEGFDTKQVFLSPSIRYSGHDTYAAPSKYVSRKSGQNYIAKVAFQVLICPKSYTVGRETIGAVSEIDPGFSNQELEWMTNEQGSNILYGLLVRLSEP